MSFYRCPSDYCRVTIFQGETSQKIAYCPSCWVASPIARVPDPQAATLADVLDFMDELHRIRPGQLALDLRTIPSNGGLHDSPI